MKKESTAPKETEPTTTAKPPEDDTPKTKTGTYRFAGVASDNKVCSEIGTTFLAKGGSAVDAAVATAVCVSVVHPSFCGIGGGFFMVVYNRANSTMEALNAREVAPLGATQDMYVNKSGASLNGGLAIAVPGELKGYWDAHQKYGKLPWKDLFQPTIKLCKEGVKVSRLLSDAINRTESFLRNQTGASMFFPGNKKVKIGDTVKFEKLATTLETIANDGASAFYDGSLTDKIVQEIQDNGGIINRTDLSQYATEWREPVNFTLRDGKTIYSMPPPGSGAVLEYMLNILDGYNLTKDSISNDDKTILTYHRIIEAMKFAFAKRTLLGDPSFQTSINEVVMNMTSRDYGDSIRAKIDDSKTHPVEFYEPSYYTKPDAGTSHVSIVDVDGNAVAITSTINYFFGAKVVGTETGIFYNNEMDDFSTPGQPNVFGISPSPENYISPGKRPLSSMCPTVILDTSKDVALVVGGSGGPRITTSSMLAVLDTLNFDMSVGEALDVKRVHHQLLPNSIRIEDGFPKAIFDGLKSKGHNTTGYPLAAAVNLVLVKDGMKYAACDYRKGAAPDGY